MVLYTSHKMYYPYHAWLKYTWVDFRSQYTGIKANHEHASLSDMYMTLAAYKQVGGFDLFWLQDSKSWTFTAVTNETKIIHRPLDGLLQTMMITRFIWKEPGKPLKMRNLGIFIFIHVSPCTVIKLKYFSGSLEPNHISKMKDTLKFELFIVGIIKT